MSYFKKSEFGGTITVRHNTEWCEGTVRVTIPSYRALFHEGPQIICSECGECKFIDCELAPVQGTTQQRAEMLPDLKLVPDPQPETGLLSGVDLSRFAER